MVRFVPHIGQFGFLRSLSPRNFIPSASNSNKRPTRLSPRPRMSLIVSIAWMDPTIPGSTPSTPPSAQEGTSPGGGGSGERQREHGPSGTPKTVAFPLKTKKEPYP